MIQLILFLAVLVALTAYFDPYIDTIVINNKEVFIMWYSWKKERHYINLHINV